MRKLIVAEFITLDGFIAKPDGQMDFFIPFQNEKNMMVNAQKDWDLLLMGRVTYETMVHFWPNSTNEQDLIAKYMNSVSKMVLSKTLKEAPWGKYEKASVLSKNIPEEIDMLKKENGKTIAVLGSAITAQYLWETGLVDEYFLLVYPVILGKGKALFGQSAVHKNLRLTENKTLGNGIIQLQYEVPKK